MVTAPDLLAADREEPSDRSGHPALRRFDVPVILIVLALFAAAGWSQRWNGDDAFIVFRVVEHVLSGDGAVYNVGERVEAVTSPLWLAVLVAGRALVPLPVTWFAVLVGLGCAVAGLGLALAGARRLSDVWAGPLLPAGALVWLGLAPAWDFATSGLETGLGVAWLGACCWSLATIATRKDAGTHLAAGDSADTGPRRGRRWAAAWPSPRLLAGAVLLGLGPVVRPDFALFSAVFLVALLALERRVGWRGGLALLAASAAAPTAVEIGRMGYYAALVPTTLLAKEATRANWPQGWMYLLDLVRPYALVVPVAAVVTLIGRLARDDGPRRRIARVAPPVAGVLYAVAVVRGGGDFMHARLLLPALFAILAPVALVRVRARTDLVAVAVLGCWAVLAAVALRVPPETTHTRDGISDQRRFYTEVTGESDPVTLADYSGYARVQRGRRMARIAAAGRRALVIDERAHPLDAAATPSVVYETGGIGLPGAAASADVHIMDRLGLADPYAARQRLVTRRRPGHDKPLPLAWVWGRYGAAGSIPTDVVADAEAARTAMSCPPLRELREAITQPLSMDRFLDNVRASVRLTTLRFPSEPGAAVDELCGDRR
jgi:arabinofuranosyltransferase